MRALTSASLTLASLLLLVVSLSAQTSKSNNGMQNCPMHEQHAAGDSHHSLVEKHGDQAMGFPHDKTTHHFRMAADGGSIEVTANDPGDKTDTEAIRAHLTHIAIMFGSGDFSTPMVVHDVVPPGVTTMNILKDKIRYNYEQIDAGGRVRIQSSDPIALAAIHDFLRFQISEHQTGDTAMVEHAH